LELGFGNLGKELYEYAFSRCNEEVLAVEVKPTNRDVNAGLNMLSKCFRS